MLIFLLWSLIQGCAESRRQPAGTSAEDRQCGPAAQGLPDAGPGGGLNLPRGFLWFLWFCCTAEFFDGAHFRPNQPTVTLCTVNSDKLNPTAKTDRERGLPTSHMRQIPEDRCTMGGQTEVLRSFKEVSWFFFSLNFTFLLFAFSPHWSASILPPWNLQILSSQQTLIKKYIFFKLKKFSRLKIFPCKELREDNQSPLLVLSLPFLKKLPNFFTTPGEVLYSFWTCFKVQNKEAQSKKMPLWKL